MLHVHCHNVCMSCRKFTCNKEEVNISKECSDPVIRWEFRRMNACTQLVTTHSTCMTLYSPTKIGETGAPGGRGYFDTHTCET